MLTVITNIIYLGHLATKEQSQTLNFDAVCVLHGFYALLQVRIASSRQITRTKREDQAAEFHKVVLLQRCDVWLRSPIQKNVEDAT